MFDETKMLSGRVALVTGASRGIGRGIALQLGRAGATVYVTGRKPTDSDAAKNSALNKYNLTETAKEVTSSGGHGIPVYCDHSDDMQVERLFSRISDEQNSRLDILVNNAYAGVNDIFTKVDQKFYNKPYTDYDNMNAVGLRNHYICTVLASRMMVPAQNGLIVTISSPAGLAYLFNVAYGIGKVACDRLAADTAIELRDSNVTHISLWPGPVNTEYINNFQKQGPSPIDAIFTDSESPSFAGRCIVALAKDKNVIRKSGSICTTGELADEYGLVDDDGKRPKFNLPEVAQQFLAQLNLIRRGANTYDLPAQN